MGRAGNRLKHVNLFDKVNKTTAQDIQQQQRATHVYLLLLSVIVGILGIYNSVIHVFDRFTVSKPSLEQYQQLQQLYDVGALDCPCSQVSITYSSFIDFECSFHPVCTSEFLSDSYLKQLFEIYQQLDVRDATTNAFTLQGTLFSHFQALRILWDLTKDAVQDARQQYLTSSIISVSMLYQNLFEKQTNTSLKRFESTLSDEFLTNVQLFRGMAQGNAFVSLYSTNWYPVLKSRNYYGKVYLNPQYYGNCNCLASAFCTEPSVPFIRGYLVGCTSLEALLQRTIECLYEQNCLDLLVRHLNLSLTLPQPLNKSETRFSSNDTINSVFDEMFIETCSSNVSYSRFFDQCHPVSCSVTMTKRNGLITIVTILLGLYGGLTISLKLIVPLFVFSFCKAIRKRKRTLQVTIRPLRSSSDEST
jgi:hypothetical protein